MCSTPNEIELLLKRSIPAFDIESLEYREAKEALFREGDRFVLYMSDGEPPPLGRERLITLSARQALLWLNESEVETGSFWDER